MAQIRKIIREELRRYESTLIRDRAAPAQVPARKHSPGLLDAEVGAGLGREADSRPGTHEKQAPARAQELDSAGTRPDALPSPQVIRENILNEGLFRTKLILFETAQAVLLPHSRNVLQIIGSVLREFPQAHIRIEGHADKRGPEDFNLALSLQRVEAVRGYLLECCRLDPDQITAVGYGESRPLATGDSPTELAMNRRVEFRILNPEALRSTGSRSEE